MLIAEQVLMLLITILSVAEEYYATYPYRQNVAPKTKESHLYHVWGWLMIGAICASMAALPLLTSSTTYTKANAIRLFFINTCIYWNVFDMGYSLLLTKWRTPFYLGNEADLDRIATKTTGKRAGLIKAIGLTIAIILLNIL